MKSLEEPSAEQMNEARLRARILAPAVNIALAPILLTATIVALMGNALEPVKWSFEMWLWISLLFVPGIAVVSIWQARVLTRGRPLNERALTGVSAMIGAASNLVGMAATLGVLVIVGTVWYIITQGEFKYPELIWQFFIILVAVAMTLFFQLAPYFLVSGAILGLTTAAIVHHTYNPNLSAAWGPGRVAVISFLGAAAAIWGYTLLAERPSLPTPSAACVRAPDRTILKPVPGHSMYGIQGAIRTGTTATQSTSAHPV